MNTNASNITKRQISEGYVLILKKKTKLCFYFIVIILLGRLSNTTFSSLSVAPMGERPIALTPHWL